MAMQSRRQFISAGVASAGTLALGPAFWEALARPTPRGTGPYGSLGPADANGIELPEGFSSRLLAQGGAVVAGTDYPWHVFSDGAATFRAGGGEWILVSNSEVPTAPDLPPEVPVIGDPGDGGASAIRFSRDGEVQDAYRILEGTSSNCAGGPTPWGTWLSCEEIDDGRVWECDPEGRREAKVRPALGVFKHEAVCVDPRRGHLYLTEDTGDSGFYRFTPRRKGDLDEGRLEIAKLGRDRHVEWKRVPDPSADEGPTREQVKGSTEFQRGEGIWFDSGRVYVATTGDSRIWVYDPGSERMRVLYDPERIENPPLTDVDNITVAPSGDLFVCEDSGGEDGIDIGIITRPPTRHVARFLKLSGAQHGEPGSEASSEAAGVCFNPRGDRMYFASQRAAGTGAVYEIAGPFRAPRRGRSA